VEQEKKKRIPLWIYPSIEEQVQKLYKSDNCKSQSEFIEKAILFYAGFLSAESNEKYLPHIITSTMSAIVKNSENRLARLLFKLAVELDITMNVVAAAEEIDDITLARLRAKCADEVAKTNGQISFDSAVKFQNSV